MEKHRGSVMRLFTFFLALSMGLMLAFDVAARCTCRNRDGTRYEHGALVCLNVDGRKYLARCEMALNVPNWKKVQEGCPVASNQSRPQFSPASM